MTQGMLFFVIGTALLSGCSSPTVLQDHAVDTAQICGCSGDMGMGTEAFLDVEVSSSCEQAILLDFHAALDLPPRARKTLFNGAWALLHYGWDPIDDPSLAEELEQAEEALGDQPVGWTLYNWASAQFEATGYAHHRGASASYNVRSDELQLDEHLPPLLAAHGLVHEGHHAATRSRHVRCEGSEALACDKDRRGANSASAAVLRAAPSTDVYVDEVVEVQARFYGEELVND
jgi:hypothetical protein